MGEYVGQAIAAERKIAGLSQRQLATRAQYSLSMVKAVEQGREVASAGFIAAVCKTLGVDPDRLYGTPYLETLEEEGPLEGLAELRAILAEGGYVQAVEPPSREELAAELAAIEQAMHKDRIRRALEKLPTLIRQLHGAIRDADGDRARGAYEMLCAAYIAAECACCRLGYSSLTALVLDRLDSAATHTEDPGYAVRSLMKRSRLLMAYGSTDVAMSLVDRGLRLVPGDSEGERVLRGYGHLRGAIVAGRGRRLDSAREHIEEARRIAAPMRRESTLYTTDFGPGNVEIHSCAVELEAGDPGKAAIDGSALCLPTDIAAPRAGNHWQDNARAWLMSGKPDRALAALNKARAAAPQQTRLHPSVRETVHGIAMAQRRQSDGLLGFASWLGTSL
ncbi:transcriptional regulator with XRE-family HTH domain [Nocardia transvalensis]|uniref:Transcriptional regulator with XRE-family HTH domain n=1 Tax=Nocardia transvalensis TaxID=37333 RepID=A0A7W9PHB0_9NOCA|nr:helix-turn-helix transcriptional regulator [Nocardia transvalensis]MBB5915910.1 transcriptional regulator with XRE-family HTH domain [Nocardia transvalensis]